MTLFIANLIGWIQSNWRLLLIVVACVVVLAAFGYLVRDCGETPPEFDEREIQTDINAVREAETNRLNNALNDSSNRVREIDDSIRQAEANTKQAANKDYSNKNVRELENELREKLKRK